MIYRVQAAVLASYFFSYVHSSPIKLQDVPGQRLLGSSFGVPGDQTFDYVIVGGGTAGLALANRLTENPSFSVAVVEAGGFYELENGNLSQIPLNVPVGADKTTKNYNPLIDWGFTTVPQKAVGDISVHYARGKCFGGSSARNFMAYQRGNKQAYDMWADMVGDSSYTWDSLLHYFQKSLDFTPPDSRKRASNATPAYDVDSIQGSLGGGGPVAVTFSNYAQAIASWAQKGLAEIGIKPIQGFTSGNLFGSSYVLQTIEAENQSRESSETAFLQPALERNNLVMFSHSLAKRIVFKGNTATGVLVNTEGKEYTLSAKNEVILSAGVFQSPQLLMVSGVGPAETLRKYGIPVIADRPGIGQNMWVRFKTSMLRQFERYADSTKDHVFFGPAHRVNLITSSAMANPEFATKATSDYIKDQSGILTNSGGDLFAWERLPASLRDRLSNSTLNSLSTFPSDWPDVEYLSVAGFLGNNIDYAANAPTDGNNYATIVAALAAPLSRGTISISSADMADPPLIDPKWLSHPTDQAIAIAAFKRVRQIFNTRAIAPVLIGPEFYPGNATQTDAQILSEIKKGFNTVWHASCTVKMGRAEDRMAGVDSKARVIGTTGLRVVDASAFALLPPGHPISTIYALSEKIADDIKSDAGVYF